MNLFSGLTTDLLFTNTEVAWVLHSSLKRLVDNRVSFQKSAQLFAFEIAKAIISPVSHQCHPVKTLP